MKTNKETENKIAQLQAIEQNIQNFLAQKQVFQSQLLELENALGELENAKGQVYRITGNIMVTSDKETLNKDLQNKKEVLVLRVKSMEKQENQLKEKASKLQSEVLTQIKASEAET